MSLRAAKGPEAASALLWQDGRMLLVRRGTGGLFPHTWTLPGDVRRPGETATDTVARVVRDRCGLEAVESVALRHIPQPGRFRDWREPETVVHVREWREGPPPSEPYAGLAWFAPADLTGLRIFREARDELLLLTAGLAGVDTAQEVLA